ncbi:hypothetical protein KAW80_00050 [Candidatus Babeliales bacterium]|nr:hypothetical protein [Candidatus Babeliales bacterium]
MVKRKTGIFVLISSFILAGVFFTKKKPQTETVVVWIHGTLPLDIPREKKLFNLKYFPFQAISKKGLHKVNETSKTIPSLFSNMYKLTCEKLSIKNNLSFYTFGWNGKLNDKSRIESAFKLYEELNNEITKIKKTKNCKIEIIILAHSHGSNVALNLARAENGLKNNLLIDKLVLFGGPVQSETKNFINSKIFKHIYNIYSKGDIIQVADIFSTHDFFSKRSFKQNNENLASNITEIEVVVNKFRPTHSELWLLGTIPIELYRKKFPLYPIPLVAFTPILINEDIKKPSNDLKLIINKDEKNCNFSFIDKKSETACSYLINTLDDLKTMINQWE